MKTVILFNYREGHGHDFQQLQTLDDYRFIALLNSKEYTELPEDKKQFFAKIHIVDEVKADNVFSGFAFDETQTRNIIEEELKHIKDPSHITMLCTNEFNLLLVGKLRDEYTIPGSGYKDYLAYRDKIMMKQLLQKAKLRVPKFCHFDFKKATKEGDKYYQSLLANLGPAFVLKPIDGASSIATHIITSQQLYHDFIRTYGQTNMAFEGEEYIDGKLYHCDSLIHNGEFLFMCACEYSIPNIEFLNGSLLASMHLKKDDPLRIRLEDFSKKATQALGLIDGPVHMELFVTHAGEIVFLEAAARTPGIGITPLYHQLFGINLYTENLRLQLTLKPSFTTIHEKTYGIVGIYPLKKGHVSQTYPPTLNSHYNIQWYIKPGDEISTNSKTLYDIAARIVVTNTHYDLLRKDFEILRTYIPYDLS